MLLVLVFNTEVIKSSQTSGDIFPSDRRLYITVDNVSCEWVITREFNVVITFIVLLIYLNIRKITIGSNFFPSILRKDQTFLVPVLLW